MSGKENKKDLSSYPGIQKQIWTFNASLFFLIFLAAVFFCLTAYSILQDNLSSLPGGDRMEDFFSLKLLDTKTACSIFVSLVGLILVRHQFILGLKPRIIYETQKVAGSDPRTEVWEVKIRNVGLGAAVISRYEFRLGISEVLDKEYDLDFRELLRQLELGGIYFEKDFFLFNITMGYTLSAKDEKVILRFNLPKAYDITQLDVKMIFGGFLGGMYRKEVYLIPRQGIPRSPVIDLLN